MTPIALERQLGVPVSRSCRLTLAPPSRGVFLERLDLRRFYALRWKLRLIWVMTLSIQHANRVLMVSSVELPIYGRRVLVARYRQDDNCLDVTYRSGRSKTFNAIDRPRALALLAVMMSGNPKRR